MDIEELLQLQHEGSGKGRKRQRPEQEDNPIAIFIREARSRQKLTQMELAKRVGVGLSTLRDIEQGKHSIKLATVNTVLNYFGSQVGVVSLNYFNEK